MTSFFQDYVQRLEDLHQMASDAIAGLSVEALDWAPGTDTNSLAVLIVHTCHAERYWISVMGGGESFDRNRSEEFQARGLTAVQLQAQLDAILAHSRQTLANLTLADLDNKHHSPMHEQEFVVSWSLLHALEHTAEHAGQMALTRQLWEQVNHQS